jgi:hypothetical protein
MTKLFPRTSLHVTCRWPFLFFFSISAYSDANPCTGQCCPLSVQHNGERREYQVHSPALLRLTTHLRLIYFLALPCPRNTTALTGVAQQMEAFCAIHLSCSGTHYNGHSIYLLLPILISGGEESLEPGSHVTSKRQVHGSRHLLQRGAASSAG